MKIQVVFLVTQSVPGTEILVKARFLIYEKKQKTKNKQRTAPDRAVTM
jgi:hypothetical protein